MRSHGFEFKLDRTKRKIQRIKNQPFFLWRQRALWLGMFFDSYCSGGLRPSMGNGSALIETPLQGKTPRWNGKSLNHCLFEIRLCTAKERGMPSRPCGNCSTCSCPFPLESWITPKHTGGAYGSERRAELLSSNPKATCFRN